MVELGGLRQEFIKQSSELRVYVLERIRRRFLLRVPAHLDCDRNRSAHWNAPQQSLLVVIIRYIKNRDRSQWEVVNWLKVHK